jgi:RNA polymerase sigma factor (sigma-70 family)
MRNSDRQYSDEELIARIKEDSSALDLLYKRHRAYCLRYIQYIDPSASDQDIYHDAVLVLFEKLCRDNHFTLRCSIQTYLNSVAKNMIRANKRKEKKEIDLDEDTESIEIFDVLDPIENEGSLKMNAMLKALNLMKDAGGKCFDILLRYFYLKQSMERIAYEMDYTNADNAKTQKARCQKRLKILSFNILLS